MWGVEIETKIKSVLEHYDPKYRDELSGGFFYKSNPLHVYKLHMREFLVYLLDRGVSSSARILDFACGTGQMLLYLWHFEFRNLHGWDANARWLSGANELFSQLADPTSVQFRSINREAVYDIKSIDPQPFDVIMMLGLIYGMGIDPVRAIRSAAAAVKPNGYFICNDHVHEPASILKAIDEAGLNVRRHIVAHNRPGPGNNVYFAQKIAARKPEGAEAAAG